MAATSDGPVLTTERLTKVYRKGRIALSGVDLSLGAGEVLGVLGPNGAGKSTLLKLLVGLQPATSGKVWVFGKRMGPNAGLLRQRIGYLSADLRFPDHMTPIDYLDFAGKLSGMERARRRSRVGFLVRAADLGAEASQPIRLTSTGMRTRLAVAASLIHDPDLVVWDEPSRGLDPESRQSLIELTGRLAETKTVVLCTHSLSDVQQMCTTAVVLDRGQVVFHGDPSNLAGGEAPSHVEIELKGDKKAIAEAFKSIQAFDELASASLAKTQLVFEIASSTSHATALANVLVTLADHNIEMTDLRVSGGSSAGAIAGLIREEKSRGLIRVHQPAAA
jgi:ABC-2 type transport system ATP-binding protein